MKSERVDEIYNRLSLMEVRLDPDPVSRGPKYMQDLISLTRGYLNEVGNYVQEAHREHHRLEASKEALETAFQVQSDDLLTSDSRVMNLPAVEDRRAMINVILRDQRREIAVLSRQIKDLDHVEKALRFRHKELENTMGAIRLQKALVALELGTGSFYGDESDTSRGSWGKSKASPPEEDLDDKDLLESLDKAVKELETETGTASASETSTGDSVSVEVSENPKVATITGSDSATTVYGDTFGFDDILSGLEPPISQDEPKKKVAPQDTGQPSSPEPNQDSEVEAFLVSKQDSEDEFEDILRFV